MQNLELIIEIYPRAFSGWVGFIPELAISVSGETEVELANKIQSQIENWISFT